MNDKSKAYRRLPFSGADYQKAFATEIKEKKEFKSFSRFSL